MYVSNLKVCVNERQRKNQMADFGNVQNLPFAFFPLSSHIISILFAASKINVSRKPRASIVRIPPNGYICIFIKFYCYAKDNDPIDSRCAVRLLL